jgi:hypothetical protein
MLTPEDIKKLEESLATKEDLVDLATKKDLEKFITKEDSEKFATKEDLLKLVALEEFDQFRREMREDMNGLREMVQALTVAVDRLVFAVEKLSTEYAAVKVQVDRHEKWIQQLAEKLSVKLEY